MSRFIQIPSMTEYGEKYIFNSDHIEMISYDELELKCVVSMKSGSEWTITFVKLEEMLDFIKKNFILFNA